MVKSICNPIYYTLRMNCQGWRNSTEMWVAESRRERELWTNWLTSWNKSNVKWTRGDPTWPTEVSRNIDYQTNLLYCILSYIFPAPLINIKKTITKMRNEVSEMNVRIGVLEYSLMCTRVRDRTQLQEDMNSTGSSLMIWGITSPSIVTIILSSHVAVQLYNQFEKTYPLIWTCALSRCIVTGILYTIISCNLIVICLYLSPVEPGIDITIESGFCLRHSLLSSQNKI